MDISNTSPTTTTPDIPGNIQLTAPRNLTQLPELRLNFFAYCRHGREWYHPGQRQGAHALYMCLSGDGTLSRNGRTVHMQPGQAYLLPKGKPIDLTCTTGVEKYWCYFSLTHTNGYDVLADLDDVIDLGSFHLTISSDHIAPEALGKSAECLRLKAEVLRLLCGIPDFWDRALADRAQPAQRYARILAMINDNLSARLRVQELADLMSVTPQSLSRAFKRDMGVSLKRYLLLKLTERASALLAGTDMQVREIADELGYDDEYLFSRNFTLICGMSPTAYRKFTRGKT